MKERLPLSMNKRPVTVKSVDETIDNEFYTISVWNIIERTTDIGLWHRLTETQGTDPWILKKLYTAIRMRLYMRGLNDVLHIRVTSKDGFCFQWTGNPREEPHKSLIEATHRARLDKKLKLNEKG
jgi:hypothetical protein